MSTSYVDEYLVKLGASVDQSGLARFHQALREASAVSEASAANIAGAFVKAQTEIIAGFVAIGSAAVGLVDKVAMADQSYRLFALHMYMSKDAARSLKVAMDALGEPLENLTWDKELRDRTHQLIADQQAMAPGGDFEAQMKKVRDIRFEFTRMEVEGEYLAMHVVQDFMKALGMGPDDLLVKLRQFNDWATHNLPEISDKLVHLFLPVWKDVKEVALSTAVALQAVGLAFTNIVGALTGDSAIEGTTFDFEKFAGALQHVVHWFALFAEVINSSITAVANLTSKVAELFSKFPAPVIDAVIGAGAGFVAAGPLGAVGGALVGVAVGPWGQSKAGNTASMSDGSPTIHAMIDKYATSQGVDPALAHAIAMHESGEQQFDKNGTPIHNPGSSATGAFQLLKGTAKTLGVDSAVAEGNVAGGVRLLHMMLLKYHNNLPEAIGAYQVGDGMMDRVLAGKATLPGADQNNIANIMQRMGKAGDFQIGNVTIHVNQQPGEDGQKFATRTVAKIAELQNKQVQRNLNEFQDASWSY